MKNAFYLLVILMVISCKQISNSPTQKEITKPEKFISPDGITGYRTSLKPATLNDFNKYLNYLTDEKIIAPVTIVFFTTSNNIGSEEIKKEEIGGISLFQIVNNKLTHSLYIRKNGKFQEQREFSLNTPFVGHNQLLNLYDEVIKSGFGINSYLAVFNPEQHKNWANTSNDLSLHFVAKRYANINRQDPYHAQIDGSQACQNERCGWMHGCECLEYNEEMLSAECDACTCSHTIITGSDAVNSFTSTYLSTYFDATYYETFRDNIMSIYSIGHKYNKYYYALSQFLDANHLLDVNDYIYILYRMPKLKGIADKLSSSPFSATTYLLSSADITALNELITRFTAVSTNTDYRAVLGDISNDISNFSNKSVATVISEIQ